jgi:hypothetical protein
MKKPLTLVKMASAIAVVLGCGVLLVNTVQAHCDTIHGPVALAAQAALEKGNVTPVLKWVRKEHEAEVKAVFQKTLAVRTQGPEARELADRLFLETLVRLHRAGEGEPYTGIKDEPAEPIVALADQALDSGSPDTMIAEVTAHVTQGIRARFQKALEAKKHAEQNVEAGREFVEAYVQYMHCVEGIHRAATAVTAHSADADGGHILPQEHGSPTR